MSGHFTIFLGFKKKDLKLWLHVIRTSTSFQILAGLAKAATDQ
jgi:hypothetical protein